MSHAKAILMGMIRGNLEQAYGLLEIGKYTMAQGHLEEARLQIEQLSEVDLQDSLQRATQPQQQLIDLK